MKQPTLLAHLLLRWKGKRVKKQNIQYRTRNVESPRTEYLIIGFRCVAELLGYAGPEVNKFTSYRSAMPAHPCWTFIIPEEFPQSGLHTDYCLLITDHSSFNLFSPSAPGRYLPGISFVQNRHRNIGIQFIFKELGVFCYYLLMI